MILPDGNFIVMQDKDGRFHFHSDLVDLQHEPLVFPIEIDGMTGTLDIWLLAAILHPANGPSQIIPAQKFAELLE